METYIIIISAAITSLAIAYKIVTNLKNNSDGTKIFPMVLREGNHVLPFPVVESSSDEEINPISTTKVHLKMREIESVDIDAFDKISSIINWYNVIDNIINDTPLEQPNYSSIDAVVLHNCVIVDCIIELDTPIRSYIEVGTDLIIKTNK